MTGSILLAIAMMGATALSIGGYATLQKGGDKTRGWLMIGAALVVVGNVLIVTV